MANDLLIEEFDQCVTQLANGATINDCVQLFPQHQDELRAMLEATRVPQKAQVSLDEVRFSQARVRLQFEKALFDSIPRRRPFPLQRVASIIFMMLFIGSLLTTGIVVVAQDSLPGDALYGIKRWSEQVRLSVTSDKDTLQATFNQRRIDETIRVIEQRREVDVRFVGVIDRVSERAIFIADLEIELADSLQTVELLSGMQVEVFARTRPDQRLLASDIHILSRLDLENQLEERPTPTIEVIAPTPTTDAVVSPTRPVIVVTREPTPTMILPTEIVVTRDRPASESASTPSDSRDLESPTQSNDCVDSMPEGWIEYRIQAGDTPLGIAIGTDLSLEQLLDVNCDLNPRLIRVGDVIYVPFEPRLLRTATPTPRVPDIQPVDPTQQQFDVPNTVRPTLTATRQGDGSSSQRERDKNNSDKNDGGR